MNPYLLQPSPNLQPEIYKSNNLFLIQLKFNIVNNHRHSHRVSQKLRPGLHFQTMNKYSFNMLHLCITEPKLMDRAANFWGANQCTPDSDSGIE